MLYPHFYDLTNVRDRVDILRLLSGNYYIQIVDEFDDMMAELRKSKFLFPNSLGTEKIENHWVYYPWRNTLVHVLPQKLYNLLRTSRNRNLITLQEQEIFRNFKVGIAGLNVGNPVALCLALEGGASFLKFADNDILSFTNMNRFRAGIPDLGLNKVVLSARQIFEIDPYIKIQTFIKGLVLGREDDFLLNPKIDILVEEMDHLPLKISIRKKAKKYRIPVIMVTGNGSNVIIDIERYDKELGLSILNGFLPKSVQNIIDSGDIQNLSSKQKIMLARDFMGKNYLTKRLNESFDLVGSELSGIPQLSEASFLRGAVVCYFIRKIALGDDVPSGRYSFGLDNII